MTLEYKYLALGEDLKVENGRTISGYASIFGMTDTGGDTVEKGAYVAALERLKASNRRIKMLWQHDPNRPIGVWDEVREDDRGLLVKGRILTDVEQGREAAALVAAGAIDGLSIGYRTVRALKAAGGGRRLAELDLWEVSLVTFPMLPDARVAQKSQAEADTVLRELTEVFRAARADLAEARGPRAR